MRACEAYVRVRSNLKARVQLRSTPSKRHRAMAAAPRKHGDRKKEHGKGPVDDIGGVQKIKSSLRQTRRLLAKVSCPIRVLETAPRSDNEWKDNLAPDIRVSTERRLKSLENDLEVAERKRKEKELATRYHKVKFFGEDCPVPL